MVKLEIEAKISVNIYEHDKVAAIKINDTEIGRIKFDEYTKDTYSVTLYIDGVDICNIDYDEIVTW